MKLVYLPTTIADIAWMRSYYSRVFPEGHKRAREHFRTTEHLLLTNPCIGHTTEYPKVREFMIAKTPFSFIYRLTPSHIEVLRVWDNRANRHNLDIL
jgi:hypothetical protein